MHLLTLNRKVLRRGLAVTILVGWTSVLAAEPSASCPGDCGADAHVTVGDLLASVNLAFGTEVATPCRAFDRNADGEVTIDEIVIAIAAAVDGCPPAPTPTPTRSASVTRTGTMTRTPTVTATPTPTVNHAPVIPARPIYRTYPGYEISAAIGAVDPEGDAIHCSAGSLPEGATFDAAAGVFTWTPRDDQLGPFLLPFTCTDEGIPPLSADGLLSVKVSPPDLCAAPVCVPASGCTVSFPPLTQPCCVLDPSARVPEPVAGCPAGRVLFVGRNNDGFGRMQDCDTLRIINFSQSGAIVQFHIEARCVNANLPVIVRTRMETRDRRLVSDVGLQVVLQPRSDGFADRYFVRYPVGGSPPYFDLEGAEANLRVTLTDVDNVVVEESLRLKLTFTPIPDLPESDPTVTPAVQPIP